MNKINIDFENCFGIGKLNHDFKFEDLDSNTFLIYAPNGTMKTSFARTFDLVSKNDIKNIPRDRIYTDKASKYEILVDDLPINQQNILVLNAEDNNFDATSKISNFLASKDLKKQYDDIYSELNVLKNEFLKKLKIENIRFYLNAQNLITFTKYKDFDPERLSTQQYVTNSLPQLKIITAGVNVTF